MGIFTLQCGLASILLVAPIFLSRHSASSIMLQHDAKAHIFAEAHLVHSLFLAIKKGKLGLGGVQRGSFGDRNGREGGPLLGFLHLEDFLPRRRRRLEEEEEDGREEGSFCTKFVSFLPFFVFPSLDNCISSSIYVLVSFLRV